MARPPRPKIEEKPAVVKPRRDYFVGLKVIVWLVRPFAKFSLIMLLIVTALVGSIRWFNPPLTYLMYSEYDRLGVIYYKWRDLEDMSTNIPLAIAAAEDANFCDHNGFDFDAIESALADGSGRGASTITQQVAKNVFLWPGRNWYRKGLEAGITVIIESLWSKRRIMEVYLNVAEFDEGVFGIDQAVARYYGSNPDNLRMADAARLAVMLPNPKERAANRLSMGLERRASQIAIGGSTLRAEGRADCFLPKPTP